MKPTHLYFPLALLLSYLFNSGCEKDKTNGLPTDGDGNVYDTVVIGSQTWLKENLKSTSYRDGSPVRLVEDNTQWITWQQGAYCWYNNDISNKDAYGALYNWHAANTQFLCPEGWHVPIKEDWTVLINFLGGEYVAGGKLKEAGFAHWVKPNSLATNESGFTGLPGGYRYFFDGTFDRIGEIGEFWVSDIPDKMILRYSNDIGSMVTWYKQAGLSVRCVKDKQ